MSHRLASRVRQRIYYCQVFFRPHDTTSSHTNFTTAMDIPSSMSTELQKWNNGNGIDLESWINCSGSFSLAVGYITIFWPKFVEFDGYILRDGFCENSLRSFEAADGYDRKAVERVMNHLHIADIQYYGCEDISRDKIQILGATLKEIYTVKLKAQFPKTPCVVELFQPEDGDDLWGYQISFWQEKYDSAPR